MPLEEYYQSQVTWDSWESPETEPPKQKKGWAESKLLHICSRCAGWSSCSFPKIGAVVVLNLLSACGSYSNWAASSDLSKSWCLPQQWLNVWGRGDIQGGEGPLFLRGQEEGFDGDPVIYRDVKWILNKLIKELFQAKIFNVNLFTKNTLILWVTHIKCCW